MPRPKPAPLTTKTWWWLDTGWGCGGICVNSAGVIVETAPIFRRLIGQYRSRLGPRYKLLKLPHQGDK